MQVREVRSKKSSLGQGSTCGSGRDGWWFECVGLELSVGMGSWPELGKMQDCWIYDIFLTSCSIL